jgi:hypothetical protein
VPGVLMAISERFVREANPDQAAVLWAATKVLMGLRYSEEQVEEFTKGTSAMILGIRGIEESLDVLGPQVNSQHFRGPSDLGSGFWRPSANHSVWDCLFPAFGQQCRLFRRGTSAKDRGG